MSTKMAVVLASAIGDVEVTAWAAENGATESNAMLMADGGIRNLGPEVAWLGIPPSPDGHIFNLRAPEGAEMEDPRWVQYYSRGKSVGWNYTRDLVVIRIGDGGASA